MYNAEQAVNAASTVQDSTPEVQAVLAIVTTAADSGEFEAEIPSATMNSLSDDQLLVLMRFHGFAIYTNNTTQKHMISWKEMWVPRVTV